MVSLPMLCLSAEEMANFSEPNFFWLLGLALVGLLAVSVRARQREKYIRQSTRKYDID